MILNCVLIDLQRCALQNYLDILTCKIANSKEKYEILSKAEDLR